MQDQATQSLEQVSKQELTAEVKKLRARIAELEQAQASAQVEHAQEIALLSEMMRQMPDVVLLTDMQGKIVRWLGKAPEMFGYDPREVVGRPVSSFHRPDIRETMTAKIMAEVLETGEFFGEIPCLRKDGSEIPIETTAKLVYDEQGQPAYLIGVNRDVSKRKATEEAFHRSEQMYRTLATNFPNGTVSLFDHELRYFLVEGSELVRLGLSKSQMEGHTIWEIYPPEVTALLEPAYRAVLAGTPTNIEVTYRNSIYHLQIVPLKDSQGSIYAGMVMGQNVTLNKQAEQERLSFHANVLAQVNDAVVAINNDQQITYWNQGAERMYGFKAEEVLGKAVTQITRFRWMQETDEDEAYAALASKGRWQGEAIHRRKNGEEFYLESSVSILKSLDGTTNGLLSIHRDITERKHAEKQLSENRKMVQAIVDNSTANIYVKDIKGYYLLVNRRVEELYSFKRDEVIGKTDRELFPDTPQVEVDRWRLNDLEVVQNGVAVEAEESAMQNGTLHTYLSIKFPLYDNDGQIYGVGGISTDITERKRTEEARQQLDQLKDEFLIIASHELRTPLTSIKGFTQVLQRSIAQRPLPEFQKELRLVNNIDHQTNRLNELISEMLDVSRIQSGQLQLNFTPDFNLVELVQAVIEQQQVTTTKHLIELQVSQPEIRGSFDQARIEQVLNNLISNAIKYSPANQPIKIKVEYLAATNEVVVSVKDNGVGISPDQQKYIFDRFYRVREDAANKIDGLGLGLYITHEIVTRHGGRVWLESVPEIGSTFYFAFPLHN